MIEQPDPLFSDGPISPHALILAALDRIQHDVSEIKGDVKTQNGRVREHESAIKVLQWAVFVGGAATWSGLCYLIVTHLR